MPKRYFSPATFKYLEKLEANNNRIWFESRRQEYEDAVRSPALDFISAIADELHDISPHFLALPRKVGGSLMRVHRDVRFAKDKIPYKTNIGIQFRHTQGKNVHAPGFYVHLAPNECFLGVGVWRPDAPTLARLRTAIAENSAAWIKASRDKKFSRAYELAGDSLVNAPRGYAKNHPLLQDLKRKDFIAIAEFHTDLATSARFQAEVVKSFRTALPYMRFLCRATELPC